MNNAVSNNVRKFNFCVLDHAFLDFYVFNISTTAVLLLVYVS